MTKLGRRSAVKSSHRQTHRKESDYHKPENIKLESKVAQIDEYQNTRHPCLY